MNDTTIESILFHAPAPSAPPELLKRLQAGIVLPAAKPAVQKTREWQSLFRRWLPALAFGVFLLSCMIVIGVQANWSAHVKRQNEMLKATAANLPQLRQQHAAFEKAAAQQDELAQLQKDNQELHALQTEVAQLRDLPVQIQRLQNENQRLTKSLAAPPPGAEGGANFFDEVQQQADRVRCVNNLKQLGLAMRIWGGDNDGKYPTSLVVMSNELSTVKVLLCPSDKARKDYSSLSFSQFQDNMTSYQYIAQPDDERFPDCITAYCPIHHNYLLGDGSVQQFKEGTVREVKRDGRLYIEQTNSGSR